MPRWGDAADLPISAAQSDRITPLLQRLRINTVITGIARGHGSWGVALPPVPSAYLAVFSGSLIFKTTRTDPITLYGGDCVLVCQPGPAFIASSVDAPTVPIFELVQAQHGPNAGPFNGPPQGFVAGDTTQPLAAEFMGGPLMFDSGVGGPLRSALPEVIVLRNDAAPGTSIVPTFVPLLRTIAEHRKPGAPAVANQIATLLFIEAVRQHLETIDTATNSWAAALFDEHLGPMLSLLHATPARGWTLEDMANEAGLGRTVFIERFQRLVGTPPISYLREHRLQMARDLLRTSDVDVRAIAARVGYASEPAFCKVFKRATGQTPGEYRAAERAAPPFAAFRPSE